MVSTTLENQMVEGQDVHGNAAETISTAVKWSAACAAIPLPYVDLLGLACIQVKMVRDLATVFGVDPNHQTLQGVISALLGTMAAKTISTTFIGSSLKVIPGGGTIIGSAGVAAFGAASTYAIGKVFVRHFEGGGTISSFSAEAVQNDLKEELSSAKKSTK